MAASELAVGLSRAIDEHGRALHSFDAILVELETHLKEPVLEALDQALQRILASSRETYTSKQWVLFQRRLLADKADYLERDLSRVRWYDLPTFGISYIIRRQAIVSKVRQYRRELEQSKEMTEELEKQELATQVRIQNLYRRIEEMRNQVSSGKNGSAAVKQFLKDHGPWLGRAAVLLIFAGIGLPMDPAMLMAAAAGAIA